MTVVGQMKNHFSLVSCFFSSVYFISLEEECTVCASVSRYFCGIVSLPVCRLIEDLLSHSYSFVFDTPQYIFLPWICQVGMKWWSQHIQQEGSAQFNCTVWKPAPFGFVMFNNSGSCIERDCEKSFPSYHLCAHLICCMSGISLHSFALVYCHQNSTEAILKIFDHLVTLLWTFFYFCGIL